MEGRRAERGLDCADGQRDQVISDPRAARLTSLFTGP